MRIVHYHRAVRLESGGVVRAVLDLAGALAAAGHEVVLASPDPADVPDAWRTGTPGCPEVRVVPPPRRPGGFYGRGQDAELAAAFEGADLVHLHAMWTTANVGLARVARAAGIPYVLSVHGMLDDWSMAQSVLKKRIFLALFGRRLLAGAAAIHTTAEAERVQASRWFDPRQGVVVPLVMDLEPYRDLPGPGPAEAAIEGLASDRPRLLFLSRIHPKKRADLLIEAAARLRADGRPVQVVVAGTGDDQHVQIVRDRGRELAEDVLLPGFVTGVEKVSLLQAADVFVLPTSQENFGFVLFEALAAGTPVVTTRGADTWPEMEASGGAVVTDGDPGALAAAIAELLDDPDRRSAMGAAGRAWVLSHLETSAVVAAYERLYRHLAGGGRGEPARTPGDAPGNGPAPGSGTGQEAAS